MSENEVVGKYVVSPTFLGKGAWSIVQVGLDSTSGVEVAVKIINREKIEKHDKMMHGIGELHEVFVMRSCPPHRNIVRLLDVQRSPSHYYLFLEKMAEDIGTVLIAEQNKSQTGLTEARCRRYIRQIACAVATMHDEGIAHRDLKPENILLDSFDVVKITDFGLAKTHLVSRRKVTVADEMCHELAGTYRYCAPEMFGPSPISYDAFKTDSWSIGVIMFVLLTGSFPFPSPTVDTECLTAMSRAPWLEMWKSVKLEVPSYVSIPAKDLLTKLLTKDPAKRITVHEVFTHPWIESPLSLDDALNEIKVYKSLIHSLQKDLDEEKILRHKVINGMKSGGGIDRRCVTPAPKKSSAAPNTSTTTTTTSPFPAKAPMVRRMPSPNTGGATTPTATTPSAGSRRSPIPLLNRPATPSGTTHSTTTLSTTIPLKAVNRHPSPGPITTTSATSPAPAVVAPVSVDVPRKVTVPGPPKNPRPVTPTRTPTNTSSSRVPSPGGSRNVSPVPVTGSSVKRNSSPGIHSVPGSGPAVSHAAPKRTSSPIKVHTKSVKANQLPASSSTTVTVTVVKKFQ